MTDDRDRAEIYPTAFCFEQKNGCLSVWVKICRACLMPFCGSHFLGHKCQPTEDAVARAKLYEEEKPVKEEGETECPPPPPPA